MQMDPVVLLVDRIRQAETELQAQCSANNRRYSLKRAEAINQLLQSVRDLYESLLDTAPTSALGAGELIRVAARRLPFSHARYGAHLERIADRLGAGQRLHCDLVWLRALSDALTAGMPDDRNDKTVALLALAVRGAALPVLVWRTASARRPAMPDLAQLSGGPFVWPARSDV